jgi:hypothetical protein
MAQLIPKLRMKSDLAGRPSNGIAAALIQATKNVRTNVKAYTDLTSTPKESICGIAKGEATIAVTLGSSNATSVQDNTCTFDGDLNSVTRLFL